MPDKNLFPYDLAVVAIFKDEARYLSEWLDYHLLAGVEHFYLYDNDSTDNFAQVLAPYVAGNFVTLTDLPGKMMQNPAYDDAVQKHRFDCRLMTFIDLDEFIFPKTGATISATVDEIFSRKPNAAGLSFHWQIFGSNGHETADYSRGVLERFTRRAPSDDKINKFVKTIVDPRKTDYLQTMHFMYFFEPFCRVNEQLKILPIENVSLPVTAEKIVVNHYYAKSKEEYAATKMRRGWACAEINPYSDKNFIEHDRNEVFDDGILRYRNFRAKDFSVETAAQRLERVTDALIKNLSAGGNLETALTCRAVSSYLREKFPRNADDWKICEEASLAALLKSLNNLTLPDAQLLIRELPKLLALPYPAVKNLRVAADQIISQLKNFFRLRQRWKNFVELDYIQDLLKIGG